MSENEAELDDEVAAGIVARQNAKRESKRTRGSGFTAPEPHEPPDDVDPETGEITEPSDEPEPEPEPAEPEGLSEAQLREIDKKATQAFATYQKRLETVLGTHADGLTPCPLCAGAFPAFVYVEGAGRVPLEVVRVVQDYLGFATETEYEPDPETQTCVTCKGKGNTKTGSDVPGHEKRTCPTCKGHGYQLLPGSSDNGHGHPVAVASLGTAGVAPLVDDDRDVWREPRVLPDGRLNPNYGKMPQFKIAVEPWGQTAGLGAQDVKV